MKQSIAGIIRKDGKFLIGHRLPSGEMGGRWEFPGGKVDQGETPEQAIVREFNEEMNVSVIPGDLLASVQFTNRHGPVELLAYRVEIPSIDGLALTEHTEIAWATLDEIESLPFVDSDRMLIPFLRDTV